MSPTTLASLALFALPTAQFAQLINPHGSNLEDAYQINYASNLNLADAVVTVTNAGSAAGFSSANTSGDICVNTYIYAPDERLLTCCSCLVPPNSLHSWPVAFGSGNLLSNVPASSRPPSVVIKLVATTSSYTGAGSCPAPSAYYTIGPNPNSSNLKSNLAPGMAAWETHSHPTNTVAAAITETKFIDKGLSLDEMSRLNTDCSNLPVGQRCPACRSGGLVQPML